MQRKFKKTKEDSPPKGRPVEYIEMVDSPKNKNKGNLETLLKDSYDVDLFMLASPNLKSQV